MHGIRSFVDTNASINNYSVFVGENNAGKSNLIFGLLWFFGRSKISNSDLNESLSDDPFVEITFKPDVGESISYPTEHLVDGLVKIRATAKRKDIQLKDVSADYYGFTGSEGDEPKDTKLLGWKEVAKATLGEVVYIPSVRSLNDELKLTAKSSLNQLVGKYVIARLESEEDKTNQYLGISDSIKALSAYMKEGEDAALNRLEEDISDQMLNYEGVKLDFGLHPPKADELVKSCLQPRIILDGALEPLPISSQGDGFQRSMIFSLIGNIARLESSEGSRKKRISNECTFYLIEEPELFLHPNHQLYFRNRLSELAKSNNAQVILTSHSPYFLNNVSSFSEIKRVVKRGNISRVTEILESDIDRICKSNGELMAIAKSKCSAMSDTELKSEAARIESDDHLRYLLWIDPTRANAYLSKKVLLVEGPTEKALFSFLFNDPDGELFSEKETSNIVVIDTVGKYHFFKFANLLFKLEIGVWCLADEDNNHCKSGVSHKVLNENLKKLKSDSIINDVFFCMPNLEDFIGLNKSEHSPDIHMFSSLKSNKNSCRNFENYKKIVQFARAIIAH